MGFFIILIPFVAFASLINLTTASTALLVAATLCLIVIGYDLAKGRTIKMLPAGAALLFAALGGYIIVANADLSTLTVRIIVDAGTLAIALLSLAIRLPFTLQYAREQVDPAIVSRPEFQTTNYILTLAWTLAFILMLLADILAIYAPELPLWVGCGIAFAVRNSTVYFTKWYAHYRRTRLATADCAK